MTILKVGLTGGVASGKSTVANLFKQLGIDVFDADVIAKQLVDHDTSVREQIQSYFGTVDRAILREIIFHDHQKRDWLEKLLHPKILQELQTLSDHSQSAYCILVIPLLFEAKCESLVDYVVVVDADETLQKQRLKQRDNVNKDLVEQMLQAQIASEQRLKKADFVISNQTDLAHLATEVQRLHQIFLEFCALK